MLKPLLHNLHQVCAKGSDCGNALCQQTLILTLLLVQLAVCYGLCLPCACVCLLLDTLATSVEFSQSEISLVQGRVSMAEELHRLTSRGEILEYSRDTAEKDCRRLLRQSSQVSQVRHSYVAFQQGQLAR